MLPFVYLLKPTHFTAEYNDWFAYVAFKEFLDNLPLGEVYYYTHLREFALSLYQYTLNGTGKSIFLDKTPRYYFIIPELAKIFPDAKFILLFRNPMAVLCSILDYNFSGNWQGFQKIDRYSDVCIAPRLMIEGKQFLGNRAVDVHYESLIDSPQQEVKRICDFCGLEYTPDMIEYGDKVHLQGSFVDKKSIYRHNGPVSNYKDAWRKALKSPQGLRFARGYLNMLGKELVDELGYPYDELIEYLSSPYPLEKFVTLSWMELVEPDAHRPWMRRLYLAFLVYFMQKSRFVTRRWKKLWAK
jgi:hypothetical protein